MDLSGPRGSVLCRPRRSAGSEGRREEEAHGEGEAVLHHAVRESSGCLAGEEIRKGHLVRALVYSTSKPVKNEEEDDTLSPGIHVSEDNAQRNCHESERPQEKHPTLPPM